ncbi:MAG: glycosyltransferase family 4 protein [Bacteroidetes bacterium]|nr:glycosyltransferase family 4 protein [Bacteroidota bacterium]
MSAAGRPIDSIVMKLAIVTTHPIQYNAPWFRMLAAESKHSLKVFYTWEQSQANEKFDPGFNKTISWDIPLLEGYDYTFVKNVSAAPGSHHFKGVDNPTLIAEIKNWGAEAVMVIGWPFKSHLACMRYFKGKIPVLFRGDSTMLDEQPGFKRLLRRLFLKYIYSNIDYALYVGTNNKQYFLSHGVKESKLCYVPHAIDNKRFTENSKEDSKAASEWRARLGISNDDFVILYAGKIEEKKNVRYMLKLAGILTDSKFRFVIVGNGPIENAIKQEASTDKRIIFIDFQNQLKMPLVYRLSDVFILPSKGPGETWGLALNEAMACEKPVIASNKVGGAIDLIRGNGVIIDPDDVTDAAKYINTLEGDKNKLVHAGLESKAIVKDFSFQQIVNNITLLLNKISLA